MSDIKNPPIGPFINWENALVREPALSAAFGKPCVNVFNHLRRYRAQEFIASYSGRNNPSINGDHANKFHVITRFPVRESGNKAEMIFTARRWKFVYGMPVPNEIWKWFEDYTNPSSVTLYDLPKPISGSSDPVTGKPSGGTIEKKIEVTPQVIGTNDGFRCSRLEVDNALIHQLNFFGCPHDPMLTPEEALVGLSDVAVNQVIKGWDEGNDEGTLGVLAHYLDADDSVVHNTARALFNTPYAKGVYQTGGGPALASIRSDLNGNPQTYKVKPRNLTGGTSDVACDPAVMVWGDDGARLRFNSEVAGDSTTYTLAGGLVTPTLITTSDFTQGTLAVDPAGDTIRIEARTSGCEIHIQTVSLWEPYQRR